MESAQATLTLREFMRRSGLEYPTNFTQEGMKKWVDNIMGPEPTVTRYVIHTQVVKVEEKFDKIHQSGFGPETKFIERSKGWFVYLRGSYEALHLGTAKPDFAHGDKIKITLEKE